MTATPATPAIDRRPGRIRAFAARRPVIAYCLFAVGVSVALIVGLLLAETSVIPGKVVQVLVVPGTAVVITAWSSGRTGVRRLFAGLLRWRIGTARWLLVLLSLPDAEPGCASEPPAGGRCGEGRDPWPLGQPVAPALSIA